MRVGNPVQVHDTLSGLAGNHSPAGSMIMYGPATAPAGWLLCDGAAVSRTTFATLFTALGTTYGVGNGSTTFNVPDMRSRNPVGLGQGGGLTDRSLNDSGGEETHSLIEAELAAHEHTYPASDGSQTEANTVSRGLSTVTVTSSTTGSGTAHETMAPFLCVNFIIRTGD